MKFLQIANPVTKFNQYDYKGLNLDLFVSGSVVYAADNSVMLLATNEDTIPQNTDITKIDEPTYDNTRQSIQTANNKTNPSPIETIQSLQAQNAQMLLTLNLTPPVASPVTVSDYQQNKVYQLNTACNQTILNGFSSSVTGTLHQYKFNMEYQANITQEGTMLALDPTITTVDWPTVDAGVIPHTRDQFIQLCKDSKTFKETNIYRYFALKAQVLASTITTIDQVNAINW